MRNHPLSIVTGMKMASGQGPLCCDRATQFAGEHRAWHDVAIPLNSEPSSWRCETEGPVTSGPVVKSYGL